jgi:hypothetical protein
MTEIKLRHLPDPLTIAFDLEKMRPGCILIQVTMGATCTAELLAVLGLTDIWLLAPTKNMRVYKTTFDELKRVAKLATGTETTFVFEDGP